MRTTRRTAWTALAVGTAVILAGCGGGDTGDSAGGGSGSGDAAIVVDTVQPENPLVPGNTNETGGGRVVDAIYSQLVRYNPDDASTEMSVAKSIETTDSKTFNVTLNEGWTFTDGTPVNADSFINAWNWVAYAPNGALNSYFMEPIEGFADLQSPEAADGATPAAPKAKEMTGLKKVDDLNFTITLSEANSAFESALGYTAFAPLPQSFFDASDKAAWGKKPVGNGRFKFVSWTDNQQVVLTRNDDYKGADKAQVKDLTFKIYQDQDAAYSDLVSNNLDFQQQVPVSVIAGDTWKTDLGERAIDKPVLVVQTITSPLYAGAPWDNKDFRQAISMAIDRDTITKQIFNGTRTPSKSYSSPAVEGYTETCTDLCTYDPAKAKAALAKSGYSGAVTLSYNADGDHKTWTEAVCNSIKGALGIDCQATPVATFSAFRQGINAKSMKGLFRTGWQYDYPNIQNGLTPLYSTGGSANDGAYSNPAFDAALKKAAQATPEEAPGLYAEAEKLLVEDMPAIPLWSVAQQSGHSTKLANVKVTPFGYLDLSSVTAN